MITRREFIGLCKLSLVFVPFLGCFTEVNDTDVTWFLSEQEMIRIGKSYTTNLFSPIGKETVLVNGWILTLSEAEVCKKKYLEHA